MTTTVELALRVFIVDDEPPARNRLRDLLNDCKEQLALEVVGEAANGQEALDKLSEIAADVVLLDIRMPQMDGIELAQHLNRLPNPPVVIFTTAYDAYAIKAFDLHAIDFLLKPIRLGRFVRGAEPKSALQDRHPPRLVARAAQKFVQPRTRQDSSDTHRASAVYARRAEVHHGAHR